MQSNVLPPTRITGRTSVLTSFYKKPPLVQIVLKLSPNRRSSFSPGGPRAAAVLSSPERGSPRRLRPQLGGSRRRPLALPLLGRQGSASVPRRLRPSARTSILEHGRRRPSRFGLLFLRTHSAAAPLPSAALAAALSVPLADVVRDVALHAQERSRPPAQCVRRGCQK